MSEMIAANNELTLDIKEDSEIFLEFLSEVLDHLEDAESNILSIDEDATDYEVINAIFRSIHSIKGSAGFLGLTDMQGLSHELEALLDKARKGEISITQEIIDISLSAIDALRKLRDNLAIKVDKELGKSTDADEQPINIQPYVDKITAILSEEAKPNETVPEPQGSVNQEQADDFWDKEGAEPSEEGFLGEILLDEGTITQEQLDKALEDGNKKIGEILVEDGVTTPEKIEKALTEQKPIGEILAEKGVITEPQLDNALKQQGKKVGERLV